MSEWVEAMVRETYRIETLHQFIYNLKCKITTYPKADIKQSKKAPNFEK